MINRRRSNKAGLYLVQGYADGLSIPLVLVLPFISHMYAAAINTSLGIVLGDNVTLLLVYFAFSKYIGVCSSFGVRRHLFENLKLGKTT